MTYGASGSNRDTAVELINRLLLETTLRPLAHLTCVGNTPQELSEIIGELLDVGVRGILALRATSPRTAGRLLRVRCGTPRTSSNSSAGW
ncbi:5,10-methylenetetrahydrofolate reductase, partial [Arthrobacter sp. Hiyo6]